MVKKYKVAIQCSSFGERCGIATYSERLCNALNNLKEDAFGEEVDVNAFIFKRKAKGNPDVICVQYEPGLIPPMPIGDGRLSLAELIEKYSQPIVITAHHINGLQRFYGGADGFIFHSEDQEPGEKPWTYRTIQHPSLVFEKKDKDKLREKFDLPKDKKIIGTTGFIAGTGKNLPTTVEHILKELNDDEFLYVSTAMWKGGDNGRTNQILEKVKKLGKEDQFRLDTDFVSAEELNERMQACDLLYGWCAVGPNSKGSQSGAAADMYGSRTKLILKKSAHYSFIGEQDKVIVGREDPKDFADDVINVLRNEDLEDTQDPEWLSWEEKAKEYLDYFQEVLGE